jgi:hypothetical protein
VVDAVPSRPILTKRPSSAIGVKVMAAGSISGQTSGPVVQPPHQQAEDMTAPENCTIRSNQPLIAERRPDMTRAITPN